MLFPLWLNFFIPSGAISPFFAYNILDTYQPGGFIFQCHICHHSRVGHWIKYDSAWSNDHMWLKLIIIHKGPTPSFFPLEFIHLRGGPDTREMVRRKSDTILAPMAILIININQMRTRRNKIFVSPGGASGKEPACHCRRHRDAGLIPGSGESLGAGQVFLPGEYHVQRSLGGYSP